MKIGDKIAKARKLQNMTQDQLADCLEVTRQSVSRWESDLAYPEMDKVVKLAELLHINCDYLLKDEVTESGEKIVQVEVVKTAPSFFKKVNWRFVNSIIGILFGAYLIFLELIVMVFNRRHITEGGFIAVGAIGLLICLVILITASVYLAKCIKDKEYLIKKKYKNN